jgi:hypothetical protein
VSLKGESPTLVLGGADGDGGRAAGDTGSPANGLAGAAAASVVLDAGGNGGGCVESSTMGCC